MQIHFLGHHAMPFLMHVRLGANLAQILIWGNSDLVISEF